MTRSPDTLDESQLAQAAVPFNRCLEFASQIQLDFIRTSDSAAGLDALASALRIETGSAAILVAEVREGFAPLRIVAASRAEAVAEFDDEIWSAEPGTTVNPSDGPLQQTLETESVSTDEGDASSRHVMAIPLHSDGTLIGLIGVAGRTPLPVGMARELSPLVETTAVLLAAARRQRQNQTEQRDLQISEEHHRLISELITSCTFSTVLHADGWVGSGWASRNLKSVLGASPDDLLGDAWLEHVHADDLPDVRTGIESLFGNGAAHARQKDQPLVAHLKFRWQHPDGQLRYLQAIVQHAGPAGDDSVRIVGAVIDDTEWQQSSESVHDYKTRLKALVENDPDYIATVDRKGKILSINRAIPGVNVDVVLGATIYDYQPREFRKTSRKLIRRVFRDGKAMSVETLGGLDPKSERYFQIRAVPLTVNGHTESALLIGTDVTEQKKTRESNSQRDSLLQAIGEGTSEFIFVKDRDSRMVFCNAGASEFLGLTPQEQVGTDESDFYPDTVARRIRDDDIRIMSTGKSATNEEILPTESGERVLLMTKSPWRDNDGRIIGIVGLAQDITERTLAQRALAVSEARLRTIIDAEPACVCLIARDGTLLDINASGLRMAEAESIEQTQSVPMVELMAPECRQEFLELHKRVCSGETCDAQFELIGLQGTRRSIEHHAVPFAYSPGETVHLGITRDITARRKAEETVAQQRSQLVHVARLSTMGQMVAAISHEITQPLSAISNFAAACSMLLERGDPDSTVEEHVAAIQRQSERAGNIITRIREFGRRTEPHRSTCDLRALINDALELSRADLRRRGVTVEFNSPEPRLLILADHVQIQQVVLNLISNACDAMQELPPTDRQIWIRCWRISSLDDSDSFISSVQMSESSEPDVAEVADTVVEVVDNGPGLDPEAVSHLFDPFYTSKLHGMGLGLSICRDIVKSHRGRIEAGNKTGRGARFRFTLPSSGRVQNEQQPDGVSG